MLHSAVAVSSRRHRRRLARSESILTAAMRLVGENGIEGFTLQQIADELDYAIGSLYRYFPSKGALLAELQRRVVTVAGDRAGRLRRWCLERRNSKAPAGPPDTLPAGTLEMKPPAEPGDGGSAVSLAKQQASDLQLVGSAEALMPVIAPVMLYERLAYDAPAQFGLLSMSLGDPRRLIDDAGVLGVAQAARPFFEAMSRDLQQAAADGALRIDRLEPGSLSDSVMLWAALHGVVQLKKLEGLGPGRENTAATAARLISTLLAGWGADARAVDLARRIIEGEAGALLVIKAADFEEVPVAPLQAPPAAASSEAAGPGSVSAKPAAASAKQSQESKP